MRCEPEKNFSLVIIPTFKSAIVLIPIFKPAILFIPIHSLLFSFIYIYIYFWYFEFLGESKNQFKFGMVWPERKHCTFFIPIHSLLFFFFYIYVFGILNFWVKARINLSLVWSGLNSNIARGKGNMDFCRFLPANPINIYLQICQ